MRLIYVDALNDYIQFWLDTCAHTQPYEIYWVEYGPSIDSIWQKQEINGAFQKIDSMLNMAMKMCFFKHTKSN